LSWLDLFVQAKAGRFANRPYGFPAGFAVIASRRRSNLIHVHEIAVLLRLKGLYELSANALASADLALLRSF
jgi:hypothetical protein